MARHPDEPPPERGETVERHEVVERHSGSGASPRRDPGGGTAWIWIALLVLVVLGLLWYVLSRGEPATPVERTDVNVEAPEVSTPTVERDIGIRTPGAREGTPAEPGAQQQ